jgi:hypothetical protein
MEEYGEWMYRFTSALIGGEWSASLPSRFTSEERTFGTYWRGDWVDPRAGLDYVEKRKFLTLQGLELRPLGRLARSQVPVFISLRDRVARLYPQALGSFFVASYDSQGYRGFIRPRLHTVLKFSCFNCPHKTSARTE